MNITFDPEADAMYVALTEKGVANSEEVESGVILDYDAEGQVVGVELLYLSKRSLGGEMSRRGNAAVASRSSGD